MTANCLGPCALGAVAAVGQHIDGTSNARGTVWLAGTEDNARAHALIEWVDNGGPSTHAPTETLPAVLEPAVIAVGQPLLLRREEANE